MPAERKEQIRKLPSGRWQLRYYDREGVRHSGGAFPSKSAARAHLSGRKRASRRDVTFSEHVDRYLAAHSTGRDASTIKTLTHRLGYATAEFGELTLEELERRVPEIAAWIGTLPTGSRYGIVAGASAGARGRGAVEAHGGEPGEARGAEPAAKGGGDPPVHASGDRPCG